MKAYNGIGWHGYAFACWLYFRAIGPFSYLEKPAAFIVFHASKYEAVTFAILPRGFADVIGDVHAAPPIRSTWESKA